MAQQFTCFRQFWPYYLQEHAHPGTRIMHYAGTTLVILIAAAFVLTYHWTLFFALPVTGYGFAWLGHALIERNRPATFRYPLWSLRADFLLWYRFVMGHTPWDLAMAGVRTDGTVDPAKRIG
jgi:hypothetical protein